MPTSHRDPLLRGSSRELLLVWLRVEPILKEVRAAFKDPNYLKHLESVGSSFADYLKKQSTEGYQSYVARVRG